MNTKDIDNKLPIYQLKTKKKVLDYYVNWTKNDQYNKDMIDWNYQAPYNASKLFNQFANDKKIKILDAGCGSGLVGCELKKLGFVNLHGVDFSQNMLDQVPKDIYNNLDLIDLNKTTKYLKNTFDAVICVGTFTYGHVKANALNEFVRIVKKNGLICFTINEGIYLEYKFDKTIEKLSFNNKWEILNFSKSSYIINKNVEAWLCLAKKL